MIVNKYNNGGGGSSSGVTPQEVQAQIDSALTPYWDSAITESAITEAVSGKADAKILVDFDHTSQAERASVYADLYALYSGGSGSSINKLYDFYKTVNTWQGLKIDYYGFSGDTVVFGKVVSPENTADQVVYEQVLTIDSAGNVNVVTNSVGGGPDLSAYYTSVQTDAAISAATSGKADAANVTAGNGVPAWNSQGIITGKTSDLNATRWIYVNDDSWAVLSNNGAAKQYYIPKTPGNAGDILVSPGNGSAPIWSAVTMPDMSEYTPTSGFSTINGSAITEGGNLVIQGGGDMSGFWNSAETKTYVDSAITGVNNHLIDVEEVTASALTELHDGLLEVSARTVPDVSNFVTSAQVETQIEGKNYITSAQAQTQIDTKASNYTPTTGFSTINGSAITNGGNLVIQGGGGGADLTNYWNSAQTEEAISQAVSGKVSSSDFSILDIVKIYDVDYNKLVSTGAVDDHTLYVIVEFPNIRKYLTFEVTDTSDGDEIWWDDGGAVSYIEYDLNYDENWQILDAFTHIGGLSVGDIVRFRAYANTYYDGGNDSSSRFSSSTSAKVKISGNIMSMLYVDNFVGQYEFPSGSDKQFRRMFYELAGNGKIKSVDGLVLPATSVTDGCYDNLFGGYLGGNSVNASIICLAEDNISYAQDWHDYWLDGFSTVKFYKNPNVSDQDIEDHFGLPSDTTVLDYTGDMPTSN